MKPKLKKWIVCRPCNGDGYLHIVDQGHREKLTCKQCKGKGKVRGCQTWVRGEGKFKNTVRQCGNPSVTLEDKCQVHHPKPEPVDPDPGGWLREVIRDSLCNTLGSARRLGDKKLIAAVEKAWKLA